MTGEPAFQAIKPFLRFFAELLGSVGRQAPAVLIYGGVAVAGRGLEEKVVGAVQPCGQIAGDILGVGRQTGSLKERLPAGRPLLLRQKVVVELAETLAVSDREVAGFQLLLQLEHQGAFPCLPVGRAAVRHDNGNQPLRDEIDGRIRREVSASCLPGGRRSFP